MLVITKFRPLRPIQDLASVIDEAGALAQKLHPIRGTDLPAMYYNECGCEVVLVSQVNSFADLDASESDELNNEIGLRLVKAGFILSSVEYLREMSVLSSLKSAFEKL